MGNLEEFSNLDSSVQETLVECGGFVFAAKGAMLELESLQECFGKNTNVISEEHQCPRRSVVFQCPARVVCEARNGTVLKSVSQAEMAFCNRERERG